MTEPLTTDTTLLNEANVGFEAGLTGWNFDQSATLINVASISAGINNWTIIPSGTSMAQLVPTGAETEFDTYAQDFLGISSASLSYLTSTFAGNSNGMQPTNFAAASTTLTANAGDTLNISWNYVSTDYTPWNDGSGISVVNLDEPTSFAVISGYLTEVYILGATNPGTGSYSTGSYGSTGWQTTKIKFLTSGAYKLGLYTFNLGDTAYYPYLFIDDLKGITLNNGTPFAPIDSDETPPPPPGAPLDNTDTTAPDAPSITSITDDVGSVSGIVASGGSTDDTVLVIAGAAEANSSVVVYNGSTLLGTVTANGSGLWSFTTATLSNGNTYAFNATATDADGNVSVASANYTVTVDTAASVVTITDSDDGSVNIADGSVTFTFTFTEAVIGFDATKVTVSNGTKGLFSGSGTTYTLVVTPTPASAGNITVDLSTTGVTVAPGRQGRRPPSGARCWRYRQR